MKNKKRVIHLLASNKYSGAENVACTIIEHLKNKCDIYYCSPKGKICDILNKKHISYIPIEKISIRNINKIVNQYQPEIIHAHDFKTSFLVSLSKFNGKLIAHIHQNPTWLKKVSINSIVFLLIAIKAEKVLTVSNSIAEEFVFSKLVKKKIISIQNPVSCQKVYESIPKIKIDKVYDICYVGRLEKVKRVDRLIDIIHELKKEKKDIQCVIVGDGSLLSELKEQVKKLQLEKNITFLGFQINPYLYIAQSKIFCLTSDWEGYGLVAFEALSLGVPTIVSNVGGLKEIVNDNCGSLCNDKKDFIKNIKQLLQDKTVLEEKTKNAFIQAHKLDNLEQYMEKIDEIYRKEGE